MIIFIKKFLSTLCLKIELLKYPTKNSKLKKQKSNNIKFQQRINTLQVNMVYR